jgi:hypothetical protein
MESPLESDNLQELWDIEGTIHFTGQESLRHAIRDFFSDAWDRDSLSDHTLLIMGFPAELLTHDDDEDSEPLLPPHGKILYLKDLQALFITMGGISHGQVSRLFGRLVEQKLKDMNCDYEFRPWGDARMDLGIAAKEPDESWHRVGTNYITLAVETAVTQSAPKSALDAKLWLESEESHVSQVVVIRVSPTRADIKFSVWKLIAPVRETRANALKAREIQRVEVTLAQGRPMADGTIALSFKELFEREPRPGTAERDLVFSARELGGIARIVWEDRGWIQPEALP